MRKRLTIKFVIFTSFLPACTAAALAATPSFTLAATNVSVSDTGSGKSNLTLTSVNGFTGQVGITCSEPMSSELGFVLPNCGVPVEYFTVPANGSITGSIPFTPPASVTARNRPPKPATPTSNPQSTGTVAGATLAIGLIASRFRKLRNLTRTLTAILSLVCLTNLTACTGHGGLAMTPGTYEYAIHASTSGTGAVTTTITVTVHD